MKQDTNTEVENQALRLSNNNKPGKKFSPSPTTNSAIDSHPSAQEERSVSAHSPSFSPIYSSTLVRHCQSIAAVAFAITLIYSYHWVLNSLVTHPGQGITSGQVSSKLNTDQATENLSSPIRGRFASLEQAAHAPVPKVDPVVSLPEHLEEYKLLEDKSALINALLELAMSAATDRNDLQLAQAMTLLGEAALSDHDTAMSEVYLNEALAIFQELGDESGVAAVQLHLGRMHIVERRRARRAALAYDAGLLARWHLAQSDYAAAERSLHQAIEENLSLDRYGAAARDLEALYESRVAQGSYVDATEVALEAVHLHASTGRLEKAHKLLNNLEANGVSAYELASARDELESLGREFERSILQINRAADYDRLYNHYIAEGDPVRAWRFRLESNSALAQVSKRTRYQRQAGVLSILYDSNQSMANAKSELEKARDYFSQQENHRLETQSIKLLKEVY